MASAAGSVPVRPLHAALTLSHVNRSPIVSRLACSARPRQDGRQCSWVARFGANFLPQPRHAFAVTPGNAPTTRTSQRVAHFSPSTCQRLHRPSAWMAALAMSDAQQAPRTAAARVPAPTRPCAGRHAPRALYQVTDTRVTQVIVRDVHQTGSCNGLHRLLQRVSDVARPSRAPSCVGDDKRLALHR